jgi:hypothetical protein
MRRRIDILGLCLALALAAAPAAAQQDQGRKPQKAQPTASGKSAAARGGAKAQAQKPQERGRQPAQAAGRGNSGQDRAAARGNANQRGGVARANRAAKAQARNAVRELPQSFRALQGSERRSDRFVLGAVALGSAHKLKADELDLRRAGERLEVRNRRGDVLFDMDEDRAGRLGSWDLRLLDDYEARDNAPAFCRSGAGHPVWGREWCLDKGFGLGRSNDRTWSRTTDVGDIVWGRTTDNDRLERRTIEDIVGDIVFGRLALHALSLGFDEPLVGRWVAEPQGPRLLVIDSGDEPVAEFVDLNRDDRVDVLYVTHYGY